MLRPDLVALLAAVRAEPDDDTPRLVLADWLDEQGTPRDSKHAALIREQVARPTLVERSRAKLRALFPALVRADKDFAGEMARGTLRVSVSSKRFREPAYQKLSDTEDWLWVEGVSFSGLTGSRLEEVIASPLLRTVRFPEFGLRAGDTFEALLPKWLKLVDRHLPVLDSVALPEGIIRARGFRQLRKWSRFARVLCLTLPMSVIGDESVLAWRDGAAHPRLDALDLSGCSLTPTGISALTQMPGLEALKNLNIAANETADVGATGLSDAVFRESLRELRWERNAGTDYTLDATLRVLFEKNPWPALEILDIGYKCGDYDGAFKSYSLLRPDRLPRLHTLHCVSSQWSFGPKAFRALAKCGLLAQLRALHLKLSLFDETVPVLSRLGELSNLEVLELGETDRIRGDGWDALTGSKVFAALHRLGIGDAQGFTEEHARALVAPRHFPELKVVCVGRGVPKTVRNILASRFDVWA